MSQGHGVLWNLATGKTELVRLDGHAMPVAALAWSGDGARLGSGGLDGAIRVWDVEGGVAPERHELEVGAVTDLVLSQDDGSVIAARSRGVFQSFGRWATRGDRPVRLVGHNGAVQALALSSNGRRLVRAGRDATVRVWDPATGALAITLVTTGGIWAAVDPSGGFDGGEALAGFHWRTREWPLMQEAVDPSRRRPGRLAEVWSGPAQ